MDWVFVERPGFKAAEDLLDAKLRRQGITFTPQALQTLVEFSQKVQLTFDADCRRIDAQTGFTQLLEKASKAASAKANFALATTEVAIWYHFLEFVQQWRVAACKTYYGADVAGVYTQEKHEDPSATGNAAQDMAGPYKNVYSVTPDMLEGSRQIRMKVVAHDKDKKGMSINLTEAAHLHQLYLSVEEKDKVDKKKDPTHPQITAMEKITRAAASRSPNKVRLDSEEVCCLAKLLNSKTLLRWGEKATVPTGKQKETKTQPPTTETRTNASKNNKGQPTSLGLKDENKGVKGPSVKNPLRADHQQTKKYQPPTLDPKIGNEAIATDDRLKAMVTIVSPNIVPSILQTTPSPIITRWLAPLEAAMQGIDEKCGKIEELAKRLDKRALDLEHGYEEELEQERDAYAELEQETQEKIAKLEFELSAANDQINKKSTVDEKRYEELLQAERDSYLKLKKETEEKLGKLESELQTTNSKIEKVKTNHVKREGQWTTKIQTSTNETAMWKDKFEREVGRHDILKLDFEATLEELAGLKGEQSKIAEREAKCAALENELAVLRSSRTNPQLEKANIAKAVRDATADTQAELEKVQASMAKLQAELQERQAVVVDLIKHSEQREAIFNEENAKTQVGMASLQAKLQEKQKELANQIQHADQCEGAVIQKQATLDKQVQHSNDCESNIKEKDAKIAELQKSLIATDQMHVKAMLNLKEARRETSPDPTIVRALDEERMACTHLKDQLTSAANALKALALQLETEGGL
ncbi:uncharacterized protein PAC_09502 [Phialocephala subalpina]|uniref:Uncharacterized protein n=1 Tax=Phialocephala subalpina TaxID=576137 RepID=A0A1L7X3L0_9HELO|nr:uncharacterized protein PAC_09502 [Phialocephala subalpina]